LAITREKKTELLEEYTKQVKGASALVFTNYRGLNVGKMRALRAKLSESGITYMVTKNTLLGLALKSNDLPAPDELLSGPNAVAFVGEDVGSGVTALLNWIKAEKVLEISGALLGQSVLNAQNAEALAELPSKAQVLAMVLGAINGPGGALARILAAPGAGLARVINAHVEKQSSSGAAADTA
jgi:large subunit ribosomal protein L10